MIALVHSPNLADRMMLRHFRQRLPRRQRQAFDTMMAEIMAGEAQFATDQTTQGHLLFASCVVCTHRILRAQGHDLEAADRATQRTTTALWRRTTKALMWLSCRFSKDPFATIKSYSGSKAESAYGPTFAMENLDTETGFATVVNLCGYRTFLKRHDALHLLPIFCQWDRVWIDALPAGIQFRRPTTLATGGTACRFEFERE